MNAAWNPEELPTNTKFDLFDQLGDSTTLTELTVRRAHLISRHIKDLTLRKMNLLLFNCLDTTLFNLHVFDTSFDACDFACSRFEGGFFQKVNFNDCTFRQVEFVNCVFDECKFATREGVIFERCVFLEKTKVEAVPIEAVSVNKETKPNTAPIEVVKHEGRFSSIEK